VNNSACIMHVPSSDLLSTCNMFTKFSGSTSISISCRNPNLGFATKSKGLARLQAKEGAWESHCMLLGV
jgi:hypothetical protein